MKHYQSHKMTRGWFVGNFLPSAITTTACEVGVKNYYAGQSEPFHIHKIATELTYIISGRVLMNNVQYGAGDIIVIEPGEGTDFHALTETTNVVVKIPSIIGDKYIE